MPFAYTTEHYTMKRSFRHSLRGVEFTHSATPYFSSAPVHEDGRWQYGLAASLVQDMRGQGHMSPDLHTQYAK